MIEKSHEYFMHQALKEAKKAENLGEVPIGAVLVLNGKIIARGHNRPIKNHNPTSHAEIMVIEKGAKKLRNYRLSPELKLYVTLEPCTMCAAAISFARIETLIYGASDEKGGAVQSGVKFFESKTCHHRPKIFSGILNQECSAILKDFFAKKRIKASVSNG